MGERAVSVHLKLLAYLKVYLYLLNVSLSQSLPLFISFFFLASCKFFFHPFSYLPLFIVPHYFLSRFNLFICLSIVHPLIVLFTVILIILFPTFVSVIREQLLAVNRSLYLSVGLCAGPAYRSLTDSSRIWLTSSLPERQSRFSKPFPKTNLTISSSTMSREISLCLSSDSKPMSEGDRSGGAGRDGRA